VQQIRNHGLDLERLAAGLREETAAFAAVVADLAPEQQVLTCPEWQVRNLVGHIGQAHRWAAELVRSRAAAPVPDPRGAEPGDRRDWTGWLARGADELVESVVGAGPGAAVWTFLGERRAEFWLRRMLADTTVHHADAALTACGAVRSLHSAPLRAATIAPDLAADVVSEGLELLSAPDAATLKPELAQLRGDGETIGLHPTEPDVPGWTLTRTPAGPRWERRTAPADVVLAGAVQEVMLVFARRLPLDHTGVTVSGDAALLAHWLAHTAF
jgi:uncharacterized protein (TIGR03083 family)